MCHPATLLRLDFRVLGPVGKDLSNGPFAEVDWDSANSDNSSNFWLVRFSWRYIDICTMVFLIRACHVITIEGKLGPNILTYPYISHDIPDAANTLIYKVYIGALVDGTRRKWAATTMVYYNLQPRKTSDFLINLRTEKEELRHPLNRRILTNSSNSSLERQTRIKESPNSNTWWNSMKTKATEWENESIAENPKQVEFGKIQDTFLGLGSHGFHYHWEDGVVISCKSG